MMLLASAEDRYMFCYSSQLWECIVGTYFDALSIMKWANVDGTSLSYVIIILLILLCDQSNAMP